jgi:general secretion pathway protein M
MSLGERLERLEPRERQLLRILGAVFAGLLVLAIPLGVSAMIGARRDEARALSEAIQKVQDGRARLRRKSAERDQVAQRYANPAPPLAGLLAKHAAQTGLEIPESQDKPAVPHGRHHEERATKIVLRKVGLLSLSRFMEKVVTAGHPVTISRLNIRKRGSEPDSYDVEMEVSAWDRKETAKEPTAPKGEPAPPEEPAP